MTVSIIGAGAEGSLFGGYFAAAGHDVSFLDIDRELTERIDAEGITVRRPGTTDIEYEPFATTDPAVIGESSFVFVLVKSQDTRTAIENAAPMIGDETVVVTLQNGYTNYDTLREYADRVVAGTTKWGARTLEPGVVVHDGQTGETAVGSHDQAAAAKAAELMNGAGIDTEIVDDPVANVWNKAFIAVGVKPIAALTHLTDGQISTFEDARVVMEGIVEEAAAVADAKGIDGLVEDPIAYVHDFCAANSDHVSSALEDVRNERRTELEDLNGYLVEAGSELDVDTPYNELVMRLIRSRERAYGG